jgi:hypothetical protein
MQFKSSDSQETSRRWYAEQIKQVTAIDVANF